MEVVVTVTKVGEKYGWFFIIDGCGRRASQDDEVVFEVKKDSSEDSIPTRKLLQEAISEAKTEANKRGIGTKVRWE